ncbi:MAG: ComEA family DNA-binding protein [Rickettsiella sp.]|nr:ComEA family DNA-binding protein [Rickettsiella sp.]
MPVLANQSDKITHTVPVKQVVNSVNLVKKGTMSNVNINTADAETLVQELDGIGQKRAQMIIAYREKHGPFKSIEDLLKIKGIGKKILDKNRDKIII